jgi:hypothetical protein
MDGFNMDGFNETKSLVEQLRVEFPSEDLLHKEGGRGVWLTYVTFERIWDRLATTCPSFDWQVSSLQVVGEGKDSVWLCTGTLTIAGLGSRTGVGTDKVYKGEYYSEESAKAAATDAFKRACLLFGVGISLYEKDEDNPKYVATQRSHQPPQTYGNRPAASTAPVAVGHQCPVCHAPAGKKHTTGCSIGG